MEPVNNPISPTKKKLVNFFSSLSLVLLLLQFIILIPLLDYEYQLGPIFLYIKNNWESYQIERIKIKKEIIYSNSNSFTWKNDIVYYKNFNNYFSYQSLLQNSVKKGEKCPDGTKKCGLLDLSEKVLCIDQNLSCPINKILVNNSPVSPQDHNYQTLNFSDGLTFLHYTNESVDNSVIPVSIVSSNYGYPCIDYSKRENCTKDNSTYVAIAKDNNNTLYVSGYISAKSKNKEVSLSDFDDNCLDFTGIYLLNFLLTSISILLTVSLSIYEWFYPIHLVLNYTENGNKYLIGKINAILGILSSTLIFTFLSDLYCIYNILNSSINEDSVVSVYAKKEARIIYNKILSKGISLFCLRVLTFLSDVVQMDILRYMKTIKNS